MMGVHKARMCGAWLAMARAMNVEVSSIEELCAPLGLPEAAHLARAREALALFTEAVEAVRATPDTVI